MGKYFAVRVDVSRSAEQMSATGVLGACPRNSARGTRKPNSCGSTNSSRNAGTKLAGEQNHHRNSAAAILNEKHSPMPLSGVAWPRGAVKCYVSDTPVPTPLLLCPFRVARIG